MSERLKLRPYQKAAVSAVVGRFRVQNISSMLLHLPTGAGKTLIATEIIQSMSRLSGFGKVLFVAHRREILDQTARTIQRQLPRLSIQIEQGERTSCGGAAITIASVQSLVRRKERFSPEEFSLIICDECHRALAPSWGEVIEYFNVHKGKKTLLLGMTATPSRTDGRSAQAIFGETAFEISRTELEDLGYLVPMRYYTVRSDLNLDKVKMSGNDFQITALSKVMDFPMVRALTTKAWLEKGRGKKTIAFCAGLEHARHVADDFVALGVEAREVDGKTKDREQILQAFARGEIEVLTNYGVLTEGFDDPSVECILLARPTTSPLVYTQCVGRGLRTSPNKKVCVVIDIVDRSTHQLQYGATEMAGLPRKWRCQGGDPFRQARSMSGIKVTSPDAFLAIRNASSLEEVQSVLMSLPPETVVAGLDGKPVLHYTSLEDRCSSEEAEREVRSLLRQAHAHFERLTVLDSSVIIKLRTPQIDNERFSYLKWHLARITGRTVVFEAAAETRKSSNPRTLLKSMLPATCRINTLKADPAKNTLTATITGLTPEETKDISSDFKAEHGMKLEIKGQLSLF
ncbi:MAG: DEAD/DEAH box helicase [Proteobacteria bacterium]|nr:DEAD/DEAH box helicase [Pseudomonadota bacterium]